MLKFSSLLIFSYLGLLVWSVLNESEEVPKMNKLQNKDIKVAIIGGGFAGLSAFRRLNSLGANHVDLFEASNRLGGRVFPIPFEDGYLQHGAQYMETKGNPLYEMAKKMNLLNNSFDLSAEDYFEFARFKAGKCKIDQAKVDDFAKFAQRVEDRLDEMSEDKKNFKRTIGSVFDEMLDKYIKSKRYSPSDLKLIHALADYARSYYSADWSGPIDEISLKNLNSWDYLTDDESTTDLNKYGYKAILDELVKGIPKDSIYLSSKVTEIDYSKDKTRLVVNGKRVDKLYDYVIVTVPLGHLKAHAKSLFKPRLPQQKLDVIDALGVGSALKIFLVYDKPFWTEDGKNAIFVPLQVEGYVPPNEIGPALFFVEPLNWKANVLHVWVTGDAAEIADNMSDRQLSESITKHFKDTMIDVTVTKPTKIIRKSWIKDDNFLGSYSFMTVESARYSDPYRIMAKPVYSQNKLKVLFAGEATHSQVYQTTVGAYLSGVREANRLINYANRYNKL